MNGQQQGGGCFGWIVAFVVVAAIVGWAGDLFGGDEEAETTPPAGETTEPNTARISEFEVPEGDWPLTVGEGVLRCEGSGGIGAVTFEAPDGSVYGVNGTALTQGLPPIDPIWRKDPDVPGLRVNIGPLIDRGRALCG